MPAYVLFGDSFLVRQRLARLEAETGVDVLLENNSHKLAANRTSPQEVQTICFALPFLDSSRYVVLEGLLALAESRGGTRGARGGSVVDTWRPFVDAISEMPPTTHLVIVDGPTNANNAMLRALPSDCQVEEQTVPRGQQLAHWIKDCADSKGAGITPSAISRLADLVGGDLWSLDQELEKLALFATGREIDDRDVSQMVSQVREASIFEAVDAMIEGRVQVALSSLARLRDDGHSPQYIIAMVERQLRLLALASDAIERQVPQDDLRRALGTSSNFVVRKTMDQARRYSRADIAARYDRLLEADLSIKQGRLDPELALELLVGESAPRRLAPHR